MKLTFSLLRSLARALALVMLVMIGSTLLVRLAPGYLSDAREMDARYGNTVRAELAEEGARSRSVPQMFAQEIKGWLHGDAGVSRQFGVPAAELIEPRLAVTGGLLLRSLLLGWGFALTAALVAATRRRARLLWQAPATLLLAIPTAAMATLCLLAGSGGPVLVMALLIAARDFKFLSRMLRRAWLEPHLLQARAQGIRMRRMLTMYIAPALGAQLAALAGLSLVTALSALVPVEVLFDVPGLGSLAWNAAMNRDLPVLLAVTLLMALAVTSSGMLGGQTTQGERA
ncbi:MAG TPA: ABC transporter permease subunit [Acidobacteriaceae bacterium]|nr:ABC transporter permease subunit [Acidobacteriaceae bacterium]